MSIILLLGLTYNTPSIDGVIGSDWGSDEVVAFNRVATNWAGNSLDSLFLTFDCESLYIGIKGTFSSSSGNCVLVYIDRDFGNDDTTGGFNNRWDFSDESGNLDQSISGSVPANVPVSGFYADFILGSKDENSVDPGIYSDYAGLRELKFLSRTDFPWLNTAHIVVNDSVFEAAIPWNSLYPKGIISHAKIGIFAIIKNWSGDYISNQCLPQDSTTTTIDTILVIPLDSDGNAQPDSGISPSNISYRESSEDQTYHTPKLDGNVQLGTYDWPLQFFITENTQSTNWAGNSLDSLFVTFDRYYLYIGIDGEIQASNNGCLVYIDRDFSSSDTIGFNGKGDLSDNTGTLDNSITGNMPDSIEIPGFCADLVAGETNARSTSIIESPNDSTGIRTIENSTDFGWYSATIRITPGGDMEMAIPWNTIFSRGYGYVDTGAVLSIFTVIKSGDGDYISNQALPEDPTTDYINYVLVLPVDPDSNGIPDMGITPTSQFYIQSTPYIMFSDSTEPPRNKINHLDSLKVWIYADTSCDSVIFKLTVEGSRTGYYRASFIDPSSNTNPVAIVGRDTFECNWYAVVPAESLEYQNTIIGEALGIDLAENDTVYSGHFKGKYRKAYVRSGISKNKTNPFHTLRTDCSMEDWRSNEVLGTDNPCTFNFTYDSLYFYVNWNGFNPDMQKMNIAFDIDPGTDSGDTAVWSGARFTGNNLPDYVVQLDATSSVPKVFVSKATANNTWETASDSSTWVNWIEKVDFGFGEVRIPRSFLEGNGEPEDTIGIFMWVENTSGDVWASFPFENDDSQDDADPLGIDVTLGYEAVYYGTDNGDSIQDYTVLSVSLLNYTIYVQNGKIYIAWECGRNYNTFLIKRNGALLSILPGNTGIYVDEPPPGTYKYEVFGEQGEKLEYLFGRTVIIEEIRPILQSTIVKDYLIINGMDNFNYTIYDITGRKISQGICTGGRIDVSTLPMGIYYLRINQSLLRFGVSH